MSAYLLNSSNGLEMMHYQKIQYDVQYAQVCHTTLNHVSVSKYASDGYGCFCSTEGLHGENAMYDTQSSLSAGTMVKVNQFSSS